MGIGGGITIVHTPGTKVLFDKWSHMAATYDGKQMKVYLDGDFIESTSVSGKIADWAGDLNIGGAADAPGNSNFLFNGIMDELKIWNKALTNEEIKQAMMPFAVEPSGKSATCWGCIKANY